MYKKPNSSFTNIILLQGCFVVDVRLFSLRKSYSKTRTLSQNVVFFLDK
jgi:uncharacterized protein YcgI (DUF1989 family)